MNFQSNWIITSNWVAHAVDSFFRVTMSAIDMMRLIRSRLPLFLSLYLPFSLSLFLSIYRSSQDAAHLSNEAQFENRVKLPALAARHSLIERMLGNMNSAYSFRKPFHSHQARIEHLNRNAFHHEICNMHFHFLFDACDKIKKQIKFIKKARQRERAR